MQHNTVARAVSALLFVAGAGVAGGAFGDAAQQGFYGVLKAGAYYVDNPLTVPAGQPKQGDAAFRAMPEIGYRRDSGSLDLDVRYKLNAVQYSDTDDLNSVQHQLNARALWKFMPDWLGLEVKAARTQQALDPVGATNLAGLLGDTNQVDTDTYSIGPQLRHEFGSTLLKGHYNFSKTKYDLRGQVAPGLVRDADDQDGYVSIGTMHDASRFGWQAEAVHQRTTYGTASLRPFQYDRVKMGVGVPVGGRWSMIAAAGMESNVAKSVSKGGLDSAAWEAGVRWSGPQNATKFEAAIGHRYFGNSYRVELSREAKLLTFKARYQEEPTTETARLLRALPTNFLPGSDFAVNAPFLLKEGNLSVLLSGARTSVEIGAFDRKRDFAAVASAATAARGTDAQRGVFGRAVRRLNSRTDLVLDGSWEEVKLGSGGKYKQSEAGLELVREVGRETDIVVGVRHWDRNGTGNGFKVTAGYVQVAKKF